MSSKILEAAYIQYKELIMQLNQVAEVIRLLGGTLPEIPTLNSETGITLNAPGFPKDGTWKSKILFILKQYSEPISVAEIAERLAHYDYSLVGNKDLTTTVGQYCYLMATSDDKIQVIKKPGEKNKYIYKE